MDPDVALRPTDDAKLVAWVQRLGTTSAVHVTAVKQGVAAAATTVSLAGATASAPAVACGADGTCAVAFVEGSTVQVAVTKHNGKWRRAEQLPDGAAVSGSPRVAVDASGNGTIVWVDGSGRLRSGTVSGNGKVRQTAVLANTADPNADLAASHGGPFVVSWRQEGVAMASVGAGVVWSPATRLGLADETPRAAVGPSGEITASWISGDTVHAQDLDGRGIPSGESQTAAGPYVDTSDCSPIPDPETPYQDACLTYHPRDLQITRTPQGKVAVAFTIDRAGYPGIGPFVQFAERAPGATAWAFMPLDGASRFDGSYGAILTGLSTGEVVTAWNYYLTLYPGADCVCAALRTTSGVWAGNQSRGRGEPVAADQNATAMVLTAGDDGSAVLAWAFGGPSIRLAELR